jgi:hypothetical protein
MNAACVCLQAPRRLDLHLINWWNFEQLASRCCLRFVLGFQLIFFWQWQHWSSGLIFDSASYLLLTGELLCFWASTALQWSQDQQRCGCAGKDVFFRTLEALRIALNTLLASRPVAVDAEAFRTLPLPLPRQSRPLPPRERAARLPLLLVVLSIYSESKCGSPVSDASSSDSCSYSLLLPIVSNNSSLVW